MNENEISTEILELVLARLEVIPDDAVMSIGSYGELSKEQLIHEVKNKTEIGEKIINLELEYLRLLKEGIYYADTPHN